MVEVPTTQNNVELRVLLVSLMPGIPGGFLPRAGGWGQLWRGKATSGQAAWDPRLSHKSLLLFLGSLGGSTS